VDLTPHSNKSTLQQPHGPTKNTRLKPKVLARLARYHPFGEGHEQARSIPGLEQGTGQGQLPCFSTEDLQQNYAEQKSPRVQERTNFKIPTLKRTSTRPGDTNAAGLTDGNMETSHIICIHGTHKPLLQDPTTHARQYTQQYSHGPAGILRQDSKPPTRLARYHPFGEGYEQARSVLGPGTVQGQLPEHATEIL